MNIKVFLHECVLLWESEKFKTCFWSVTGH